MQFVLDTLESPTLMQRTSKITPTIRKQLTAQEIHQRETLKKFPSTGTCKKIVKLLNKKGAVTIASLRPPVPPPSLTSPTIRSQQIPATSSVFPSTSAAATGFAIKCNLPSRTKTLVIRHRPYKAAPTAAYCSTVGAAPKYLPPAAVRCVARSSQKMEHSYVRDCVRPKYELATGLTPARTILVRRPPQCPFCHTNPVEESELDDGNQVPVPTFNEIAAKEAMCECSRIAQYVKNTNPDDDDWESRVNQYGWTKMQKTIFSKVVTILDNDQLGRLANAGRQNEAMQRRIIIDKSTKRMRRAFASVAWDARLTQWLHSLLMDCLPSTYMASYLDILQTLKSKLPTLMDKMLFGRPVNVSQELLAPVMKTKWEPIITSTKSRQLTHNAVFVVLPSIPTSGPISPRMQKWYQYLASITKVVQITLPMTGSGIARQPLDQIAEQIVSLTRVKIQEMRNENSARAIILIGFNAGSALALQVAMSEHVNGVVCMGFAFNTLHGVRGTPDDRILDIKIPILFIIGQNSARTSSEEMESLREKMQSDSSLVVVGSADDALRIPKSRRKIENVTQAMVDTMIIDEVYEYVKRILDNPPGPRAPTTITGGTGYVKQSKSSVFGGADGAKPTLAQRKRKLEAQQEGADGHIPSKAKYTGQIGRPRTRNLPGTTPTKVGGACKPTQLEISTPIGTGVGANAGGPKQPKSSLSSSSINNDDLNLAIQSILSDSNEPEMADSSSAVNTSSTSEPSKKIVTSFDLVPPSAKSTPMKTDVFKSMKHQFVVSGGANGGVPTVGSKIKMIPANQFVQLKPPMQSQSKIYTIKTAAMMNSGSKITAGGAPSNIGSIVSTTVPPNASQQQQIFTLKSPNGQMTQFATAARIAQQKYTMMKPAATVAASGNSSGVGGNLDISSIIDMPIVFADSNGNISETASTPSTISTDVTKPSTPRPTSASGVGQLIISQQIIKEANNAASTSGGTSSAGGTGNTYVFNNKPLANAAPKPNKVVFINRNTMKPCPNILSRSNITQQLPKYTKVVVTTPKTSATPTTIVPRASTQSAVSPLVSSVKRVNLQTLKTAQAVGTPQTVTPTKGILGGPKQLQILNATGESPSQIRNIMLKPGGLKQIPAQLLNRNLTVRKLVNIVPAGKSGQSPNAQQDSNASATATGSTPSAIQTSPKVITLNPVNPSAVAATQSKTD